MSHNRKWLYESFSVMIFNKNDCTNHIMTTFMQIQMLSEFVVTINGVVVDVWESEKTKSVFKYLVSRRNQICLNEQIIANIWSNNDFTETRAMTLLRGRVYNARRALEPDQKSSDRFIETCSGGYLFKTDNCIVDLDEFEHHLKLAQQYVQQPNLDAAILEFEQALEGYKGDFLEEDLYESWTNEFREKYLQDYLLVLLGLSECHAQKANYPEAVALCERALKKAPLREDVLRKAMLYSFLQGNSNKAKQMYQTFVELLEQNFSDDLRAPDPATQALYDQINAGHVPEAENYPDYHEYVPIREPFERLPLIGRQNEYSQLLHWLNQAFQGQGGMLLIGGESGVGKSRLVKQAIQFVEKNHHNHKNGQGRYKQLQGRFTVFKSGNSEVSAQSPYLTLFELLRHELPKHSPKTLNLHPLSAGILCQWIFGLEDYFGHPDPPTPLAPEQERLRLFETLRQLLFRLSEQNAPLLLFLDDLHWADASTIDFLDYLLTQMGRFPLLLVGTYRSEDLDPQSALSRLVRRAIRGSEGEPIAHIELKAFEVTVFEQLVADKVPQLATPSQLGEFLFQESEGNALFLIEILNTLQAQQALIVNPMGQWELQAENFQTIFRGLIPEKIRNIFLHRIAQLPPSERALLELLSVINQPCNRALLDELWQNDLQAIHGDFSTLLETLLLSHFILEDRAHYQMAHDKFREVVYQNTQQAKRQSLHKSIAQTLEQPPWALQENNGVLAYHYAQANLPKQAVTHLIPTIQKAVQSYRNSEALDLIDQASKQLEKLSLNEDQAFVENAKFNAFIEQAKIFDMMGRKNEQENILYELLHLSKKLNHSDKRTLIHLMYAELYSDLGRYPEMLLESYKALDFSGDHLVYKARSLHCIGLYHWNVGNFEDSLNYFHQEKSIQESFQEKNDLSETFSHLGRLYWWKGLYEEAGLYFEKALDLQEKINNEQAKSMILTDQSSMFWAKNEYIKAIESYKEVLNITCKIGDKRGEAQAFGDLGLVYWSIGEYELAETEISQSVKIHTEINNLRGQGISLNNLGLVYLSLGHYEKAYQYHEQAFEVISKIEWEVGQGLVFGGFSQIHRAQGQLEKSLALRLQSLDIFENAQNQWLKGSGLHHLGQLYTDLHDYEKALESLMSALVIKRSLTAKEEEMLILSDQAMAYLGLNQFKKALETSEESLQLLQKRGDTPRATQMWWQHACVLDASGQSTESLEALEYSYQLLLSSVRKIERPKNRHSFSAITMHRNILQTYAQRQASSDSAEALAYERLRDSRWSNGVTCPYCNSNSVQNHSSNGPMNRYRCKQCDKTFNDRTGTVFANSKIKLSKLMLGQVFIQEKIVQSAGDLSQLLSIQIQNATKLFDLLQESLDNDTSTD